MNLVSNSKTRAIDGLLAIGADTTLDAAHRVAAFHSVLFYAPAPILGEDRFELTTLGEAALREAEQLADGSTPPAAPPAEAPKRRGRKPKAEEPAPVQAPPAEEAAPIEEPAPAGRGITDTPEDRRDVGPALHTRYFHHPESSSLFSVAPGEADPRESGSYDAGLVEEIDAEQFAKLTAEQAAAAAAATAAAEPETDWGAEEPAPAADTPPVTKTDLIALLNRYAAKHPKKAAGAKEVLHTFAGTESLSAVDPSHYGAIATAMRLYLEAA